MAIEFYLRIEEDKLPELLPALATAGAVPENDIACIEWENPRRKKSVYQVVTGDHLESMAEEFNQFLEQHGRTQKIADTSTMDVPTRHTALYFLANNAEWNDDATMDESWLEGDPAEIERILADYSDILE